MGNNVPFPGRVSHYLVSPGGVGGFLGGSNRTCFIWLNIILPIQCPSKTCTPNNASAHLLHLFG